MTNQEHDLAKLGFFSLRVAPGEYQSFPPTNLVKAGLEIKFNIANDLADFAVEASECNCDED
ncbi:hypothetical protein CBW58_22855 [Yersinia frederiksenii]|nr:hypothetical protein CBW58_22855 [Yersinia frederiksenii]